MGDFSVNLRGADIRVSEHLGKGFDRNAVGQADFRCHGMATGMPRNLFFDTAESDDFLDVLAGGNILRNGQEVILLRRAIVLLDNLLRNIQKDSTPVFCRLVIIQSLPSKEV